MPGVGILRLEGIEDALIAHHEEGGGAQEMAVVPMTHRGRPALGHADPLVTLRVYSHALEERDAAAAAVMGNILRAPDKEALDIPPSR
jgi:hypothetical protein